MDVEGNPYPADIQRLVPGREHLSDKEALVPNLGEEEVAGFAPASPAPRPGPASPRRSTESPSEPRSRPVAPVSNIDALIEELAANVEPEAGNAGRPSTDSQPSAESGTNPHSEHSYAAGGGEVGAGGGAAGGGGGVVAAAPASQQLVGSVWRRRHLIPAGRYRGPRADAGRRRELGTWERRMFKLETAKGRENKLQGLHMVGTHEGVEVRVVEAGAGTGRRRAGGGPRARGNTAPRPVPAARAAPARPERAEPVDEDEDSEGEEDHDFNQDSVTDRFCRL